LKRRGKALGAGRKGGNVIKKKKKGASLSVSVSSVVFSFIIVFFFLIIWQSRGSLFFFETLGEQKIKRKTKGDLAAVPK